MKNWISELCEKNENITLNDLVLPGTHNSCSYKIDTSINLNENLNLCCTNCYPISKIIKNWSINQNLEIYEQLNIGVRVFDIDISYYDNNFYATHSFIIEKLETFLLQFKKYNQENKDLYILKIVYRTDIDNIKIEQLQNIFLHNFKNKMILFNEFPEPLVEPIISLQRDNKNMIIYMEGTNSSFYPNYKYIYSDWPNKQTAQDCIDYNKLKLYNEFIDKRHRNENLFIDLNWTLTPTYKEIIKDIICCTKLEDWVKNFNNELSNFIINNYNVLNTINSISVDFMTEELSNKIININNN